MFREILYQLFIPLILRFIDPNIHARDNDGVNDDKEDNSPVREGG
jgi:hypothetical protein